MNVYIIYPLNVQVADTVKPLLDARVAWDAAHAIEYDNRLTTNMFALDYEKLVREEETAEHEAQRTR